LSRVPAPPALQFFECGTASGSSVGDADRGTIRHAARDESCEYCVVISITNERGEKIARHVVGVGALQPGEKHKYSFSVDLMPVRAGPERKRN